MASVILQIVPDHNIRKRKSRRGKDGPNFVAECLAKLKEINCTLDLCNEDGKRVQKAHAKGSKKGCMKRKVGPENARICSKWVAEIGEPSRGKRLCLGTPPTALETALAYDETARAMIGATAYLNLPNYPSSLTSKVSCMGCWESAIISTTEAVSFSEQTTPSDDNCKVFSSDDKTALMMKGDLIVKEEDDYIACGLEDTCVENIDINDFLENVTPEEMFNAEELLRLIDAGPVSGQGFDAFSFEVEGDMGSNFLTHGQSGQGRNGISFAVDNDDYLALSDLGM